MPANKPSLQERLAEVMDALGWVQADVERVSGASRSLVAQWLGKAKRPVKTIGNVNAAVKLQQESGYSAAWLAQGIEPKMAPHGVNDAGAAELLRIYMGLDVVSRARLLAYASELSGKRPNAA